MEWNQIATNDRYEEPGPKPITDIRPTDHDSLFSGLPSLDAVLSAQGGAAVGGIYLLSGEPGIGKSTLLLQALAGFGSEGTRVLYITGEESRGQVSSRAHRVGALDENLILHEASAWEEIEPTIDDVEPDIVVLDSMHVMHKEGVIGSAGDILQIKAICKEVIAIAKKRSITFFLIAHVTKDGDVGGPKTMEHMVDTTLVFEAPDGENDPRRCLRAKKNRYNDTGVLGHFQMTERGVVDLERRVQKPKRKASSGSKKLMLRKKT